MGTRTINIDAVKPRSLGEWVSKSLGSGVREGPLYEGAKRQWDAYQMRSRPQTSGPQQTSSNTPTSVTQPFQQAIDTLSGANSDVEKMYQAGKRRSMSNIAMQSVNAGMANTLNMPAAGIAYDEANRSATNLGIASAKAGVYQNLGQVAAGIYGTNVGASTSRYATDVGSRTALGTAGISAGASQANSLRAAQTNMQAANLQFQSNQANQALKKYIADLQFGGSGGGKVAGARTI